MSSLRRCTLFLLTYLGVLDPASPTPSPLQVRLLGEVALETARGRLGVEQVAGWLRRIFDDSLVTGAPALP